MKLTLRSLFSHMDAVDWILAASFLGLLAFIGSLLLPTHGWLAGLLIALVLLYLAKTRRDEARAAQSSDEPPAKKSL